MAQKRMFSIKIINSDAFLEMPLTSQLLYFHLAMRADDDGFIGNPKSTLRMVGCNGDDLKILISKRFLLSFNSGVIVIKHWLIHNTIRMDRFNPTVYNKEKNSLFIKENKAYTDNSDKGKPLGNQMVTQVKLSKVKLSKKSNSSFKKGKPFYEDKEMRFFKEKWWVIPEDGGSWLEFVGEEKDIEWRK